MIYLDNAATTRLDPKVLQAMMPYFTDEYANPGSPHRFGRDARSALDAARRTVAQFLNAAPEQIIFTSGGSESNNTVFSGVAERLLAADRKHIVISAGEHESVIQAAQRLLKLGFYIDFVPLSADGTVSLNAVERTITPETGLVSVMGMNNETGAVNPVRDIGLMCEEFRILFHTDCVQAAGIIPLDVRQMHCDFMSVSSHKLHGPKGAGVLYVKNINSIFPLIYGGSEQELGLRGGTENVPAIVGFSEACKIALDRLSSDLTITSTLKQKFYSELMRQLGGQGTDVGVSVNGPSVISPGKILNLMINGVDAQSLIMMLETKGICISAGSACQSHEAKPSHVILAMGFSPEYARSCVRISFSRMNTMEEVMEAASEIASCIRLLRNMELPDEV